MYFCLEDPHSGNRKGCLASHPYSLLSIQPRDFPAGLPILSSSGAFYTISVKLCSFQQAVSHWETKPPYFISEFCFTSTPVVWFYVSLGGLALCFSPTMQARLHHSTDQNLTQHSCSLSNPSSPTFIFYIIYIRQNISVWLMADSQIKHLTIKITCSKTRLVVPKKKKSQIL